jgi:hypothetical protein
VYNGASPAYASPELACIEEELVSIEQREPGGSIRTQNLEFVQMHTYGPATYDLWSSAVTILEGVAGKQMWIDWCPPLLLLLLPTPARLLLLLVGA